MSIKATDVDSNIVLTYKTRVGVVSVAIDSEGNLQINKEGVERSIVFDLDSFIEDRSMVTIECNSDNIL